MSFWLVQTFERDQTIRQIVEAMREQLVGELARRTAGLLSQADEALFEMRVGRAWVGSHDYHRIETSLREQERELGLGIVPGRHSPVPGQDR